MKKKMILTFITEFAVLACGILVYKFAAKMYPGQGFSEYAISRRTLSFLQPLILMGLSIEIPKHVALGGKSSESFFAGGLAILITVALAAGAILNLLPGTASYFMFGSAEHSYLIFPISVMLFGLTLHTACYSYFRGRLTMKPANLLQLINLGIAPMLAFSLAKSVSGVLLATGAAWTATSMLFLAWILHGLSIRHLPGARIFKILLFYGTQRIPGDFGLAALFTLPATFTAHIGGISEGGSVAFSISLLNMIGALFAPLGLILLPQMSAVVKSRDFSTLRKYNRKLLKTVASLGTLIFVGYEVFADIFIRLYLGPNFEGVVYMSKLLMTGSLGYIIYVSMRSVVDAYYERSINARNILITLAFFMILSSGTALFRSVAYVTGCLAFSLLFLGGLTLYEIRRILRHA